jgi:curli production assembly/transport component CsgF
MGNGERMFDSNKQPLTTAVTCSHRSHGRYHRLIRSIALGLTPVFFAAITPGIHATELVHVPMNPVFGGNPLNGPVLLNNAQAENKKTDPAAAAAAATKTSALQDFNDTLQRSILGRLASAATSNIVGTNGQLVPGTVETGDFRISIVDVGGGLLKITTTDKTTGASTQFQVGQ